MGNGIAQTFASSGANVRLIDVFAPALDKGMATIRGSLERFVKKGALAQADAEATLSRIRPSGRIEDAATAELVVEAIVEKVEMKAEVFGALDGLCPRATILSTNTSSISIT